MPPRRGKWTAVNPEPAEGNLEPSVGGDFFGDGSGIDPGNGGTIVVATWSLALLEGDNYKWLRGPVGGWFQTVPRAEFSAAIRFLKNVAGTGRYIGDCLHVILALCVGILDGCVRPGR